MRKNFSYQQPISRRRKRSGLNSTIQYNINMEKNKSFGEERTKNQQKDITPPQQHKFHTLTNGAALLCCPNLRKQHPLYKSVIRGLSNQMVSTKHVTEQCSIGWFNYNRQVQSIFSSVISGPKSNQFRQDQKNIL